MSTDRLPPHAPEAEQGILGCILLSPVESLAECARTMRPGAEAFYELSHRTLFAELVAMYEAQIPIDIISVPARLRDTGTLDAVGGQAYLNAVSGSVPSAANLPYYIEVAMEKWKLRQIIATGTRIVGRAFDSNEDAAVQLDDAEKEVLSIRDDCERGVENVVDGKAFALLAIARLDRASEGLTGLPSGFAPVDRITHGFRGGELIVTAGRPGSGKTAILLNIARHLAINESVAVGVFSLEMQAPALSVRFVAAEARVNPRLVSEWTPVDYARASEATAKMTASRIYVDDTGGLTIRELRARARRMVQRQKVKILVVDYLQLIGGVTRKADSNRQHEVAEVSAGLKAMAKELDVPVLVGAQINRESERDGRRPRLSDLRESGAIEQDADLVSLLYRPTDDPVKIEEEDRAGVYPVRLRIAKQRDGALGEVKFQFFATHQRFEIESPIHPNDIPR